MFGFFTRLLVPSYEAKTLPSKLVAIVVPLSLRAELSADEKISMTHLRHYFGKYDKYLIAPRGLPIHLEGFQVKRFDKVLWLRRGA